MIFHFLADFFAAMQALSWASKTAQSPPSCMHFQSGAQSHSPSSMAEPLINSSLITPVANPSLVGFCVALNLASKTSKVSAGFDAEKKGRLPSAISRTRPSQVL